MAVIVSKEKKLSMFEQVAGLVCPALPV